MARKAKRKRPTAAAKPSPPSLPTISVPSHFEDSHSASIREPHSPPTDLPEDNLAREHEEDPPLVHSPAGQQQEDPLSAHEEQSVSLREELPSIAEEQSHTPHKNLPEEIHEEQHEEEQVAAEPTPQRQTRARIDRGKSTYPPATRALHGHLTFRTREHKKRYDFYQHCPIIPTKSIHVASLDTLNLRAEIEELVANIGWQSYFALDLPSFTELTREFYTTFKFDYKQKKFSISTPEVIHFQLMGRMHHYSINNFNLALGLVNHESILSHDYINAYCDFPVDEFDQMAAFRALTGLEHEKFSAGHSKAYHIQSAALRCIHRFIAYSIFGCNNDSTVLTKSELFILWCMVNKRKVNLGFWLATQFNRIVSHRRPMLLGMVVTKLALHENLVSLDNDLHKACDMEPLDLVYLNSMRLLRLGEGGTVCFVPAGQLAEHPITLPGHTPAAVPAAATAIAAGPSASTRAAAAPMTLLPAYSF